MSEFKMNILWPVINGKYTDPIPKGDTIFLAGPCPREDYNDDWRFEAFKILEKLEFNGTVITPTNPNYNQLEKDSVLLNQTLWEWNAMHNATALVFWIPRTEKHPARTTNIEFGEFHEKANVFCGWPDYAIHNEYLDCRLHIANRLRYETLEDTLKAAVEYCRYRHTLV